MNLLFVGQGRFVKYGNGVIYPFNSLFDYNYFKRYLEVFDDVLVLDRLWESADSPPANLCPTTGPRVSFMGAPPFASVLQFIRWLPDIKKIIARAVRSSDAVLLRVPNYFSFLARAELKKQSKPFAVEVVGDPLDAFQPGTVSHPLRPFIRILSSRELKVTCAQAAAAAYVTEYTLQRRYPPAPGVFTTHYSSLDLPASLYVDRPRHYPGPATHLVFVGSLEVLYKAPDILLQALQILSQRGFRPRLVMVGGGRCQPQLEAYATELGLGEQVVFRGKVPPEEVFATLDRAELFVLPSLTEGLPRAMIEAMARGLPCIGSTAGGIPELLPPEDLVPPGDASALAEKILEVSRNPRRLSQMSARNLEKARKYEKEILSARRRLFYQKIREQVQSFSSK